MISATIIFFCTVLFSFSLCENAPEVELLQGIVRGHNGTSYKGRNFFAFEGIPYAKPPIGELRFAAPQPAEKWEGILEGDEHYICSQLNPLPILWGPAGTEDCLYLYVYVPGETFDKEANLPVIVHIHGGAFMLGSPKFMALPDYLMDQDAIYVTFNYRVGILGFLSTEDSVVPGNMGLKDQSMALKWIKDNIKKFGGDSESITITGLSAGAASVHYHYLSPLSKGLFSRGISHSGTALQSWSLTENPLEKAKFVARNVSCSTETTEIMVKCLRSKTDKELIIGIDGLFILLSGLPPTPFGPVIEKGGSEPFIDEHPYKLLKEGKVYDVPWINSNVKDEGILPVGIISHAKKLDFIEENWEKVMPTVLDLSDTVEEDLKIGVVNKIKEFYLNNEPVSKNNTDLFVKVFNDRFFFIDSELALRTHAKSVTSPVYYYFYEFISNSLKFRNVKPGACHGFDGRLLYKWMWFSDLKDEEEKLMFILTDFLKGFASTGIPEVAGVKWDPVKPNEDEINCLNIKNLDEIKMITMKNLGEKDFWNSLPIKENNHIY